MTTRIWIETEPTYDVVVGAGSLRSAGGALGGASGCVVVSDENVAPLYRTRLEGLADAPSITLPAGQTFPLYPLAALLPLLPAKQRDTHPHDWMTTDMEVACPDPLCGARFRITRTGRTTFRHSDVTRVPLDP